MMKRKAESIIRVLLCVPVLILLFNGAPSTGGQTQDINFRLINIERRLDQMQQRVDFIERGLQTQALSRTNESNAAAALVLELQRQQLSLAEQIVSLQKRMLDLQKTVDQINEKTQEKKEKPKQETKPKGSV